MTFSTVKFSFSEKVKKYENISHLVLTLLSIGFETKWEIFQILWPSQKTSSLTNLLGYFLTNHPCRSRYLSTNLLSRKSATMQIEKPYKFFCFTDIRGVVGNTRKCLSFTLHIRCRVKLIIFQQRLNE